MIIEAAEPEFENAPISGGDVIRGAWLSDDRLFRYHLWREWDDRLPWCVFVGINPSTADESEDDATICKCVGFARRWGFGSIHMLNLFAYRSTDQLTLLRVKDRIGPENNAAFDRVLRHADRVVCAWGRGKSAGVRRLIDARLADPLWLTVPKKAEIGSLGYTKDGYPRHPLMLGYGSRFVLR
jgi:hypothetical protein